MGRLTRPTEYYVRIDPRRLGFLGLCSASDSLIESDEARRLEMYREACDAIVEQVKRHVDDVGHASVEKEEETVCEFCGSSWTEGDDSPHNRGCCGKDCDVYEAAEAAGEEAGS